jgi:WXXGXW repeat (2 copies)
MHIRSLRTLLFVFVILCMSAASFSQIGVAITIGPPALPVYEQPICPGDGYLWTPGYWAYDYDISDYYWVPGTWVLAPEVGFLWTPPYWGWGVDRFVFYDGFWGPQVGFYGGINYGFGYFGNGFEGGRWDGGHFFYNRAVLNINVNVIHNVYNTTVVHETTVNRISYNGGRGGIDVRPTAEQEAFAREKHIGPVEAQTQHMQLARGNPDLRASVNKGRPAIAATERPGDFKGHGIVQAKEAGAPYNAAERGGNARPENNVARPTIVHPHDLPPVTRTAPNTGDENLDRQYRQEQDSMAARQQQERDQLQQRQEQEHQQMQQQNFDNERRQQMEQQHQQQTMQMYQRHDQESQQFQQRMQQARPRR